MIKVSAVDFVETGQDLAPVPGPDWKDLLLRQAGTIVNGAVILIAALLLIWFGVRPAIKAFGGADLALPAPAGYIGGDTFATSELLAHGRRHGELPGHGSGARIDRGFDP